MRRFEQEGVSLSLASLSPSGFDTDLLGMIKTVRKTGLTIAPEAGTQRLRDVINKQIAEEELLTAAGTAFRHGWKLVKLYFMLGLPTETDDDVAGIAELTGRVASLHKGVKVKVSVSNFVPKSHTPFQWVPMEAGEELRSKQKLLYGALRGNKVELSTHDVDGSVLEGVLSRGDRRIGGAVEKAWELGCRFDGWSDQLRIDLWQRAFEENDIRPEFYLHREIPLTARLPWSHLDAGVDVEFLRGEYRRAFSGEATVRCAPKNCPDCRACPPELLSTKWAGKKLDQVKIEVPAATLVSAGDRKRLRLRFSKVGPMRSIGHLDLQRLVARTFRRAGITVAMSQGFNPQPRVAFALALPLGQEGTNEYLDAMLIEPPANAELLTRLNAASPEGLEFTAAAVLPAGDKVSLSAELVAADYRVRRTDGCGFDDEDLERFISLDNMQWERRRKGKIRKFDIRNAVLNLVNVNSWGELHLRLSLEGQINVKPAEVVEAAFRIPSSNLEVVREQLYIRCEGELIPPI
jgi:radical SAM-linked protein